MLRTIVTEVPTPGASSHMALVKVLPSIRTPTMRVQHDAGHQGETSEALGKRPIPRAPPPGSLEPSRGALLGHGH